jgi:hypothetical protein
VKEEITERCKPRFEREWTEGTMVWKGIIIIIIY